MLVRRRKYEERGLFASVFVNSVVKLLKTGLKFLNGSENIRFSRQYTCSVLVCQHTAPVLCTVHWNLLKDGEGAVLVLPETRNKRLRF